MQGAPSSIFAEVQHMPLNALTKKNFISLGFSIVTCTIIEYSLGFFIKVPMCLRNELKFRYLTARNIFDFLRYQR